jgi:DNA-binding PadR family transcriptional regulator
VQLERQQRHGYEIGQLIETRSKGSLRFRVASLYPLLYRLEERGAIQGRWVENPGRRRRRFYRVTPAGRKILAACRNDDDCEFTGAVEFLDEAPPPDASAVAQIVRVDSVKRLPPQAR